MALICSLDSSSIGNGSEPNFRTVTRLLASLTGNPPTPPASIWTWPPGIDGVDPRRRHDLAVENDREVLADVVARVVAEQLRAVVLELEVDGQPARLVAADRRARHLAAGEQRRELLEVEGLALGHLGRPEGHEVEAARLADEPADRVGIGHAGELDDDPVRALGLTTGSDTPVVFTRSSTMSRMTPSSRRPACPVDLLRLVLDAEAALEVEPELRLELAASRRRRGRRRGWRHGEEVDEQGCKRR